MHHASDPGVILRHAPQGLDSRSSLCYLEVQNVMQSQTVTLIQQQICTKCLLGARQNAGLWRYTVYQDKAAPFTRLSLHTEERSNINTAQISPILNRSLLGIIQEKADVEGRRRKFAYWEVKRKKGGNISKFKKKKSRRQW